MVDSEGPASLRNTARESERHSQNCEICNTPPPRLRRPTAPGPYATEKRRLWILDEFRVGEDLAAVQILGEMEHRHDEKLPSMCGCKIHETGSGPQHGHGTAIP